MRLILAVFLVLTAAAAQASDRYVQYYYPAISSEEVFDRIIIDVPPANKEVRVRFISAMTRSQLDAPETPRFVAFVKGAESDTLIMTALDDEIFKTLYRARAQMAQLTANMRGTEFFRNMNLDVVGTFYDMLQIMQFNELIITDGETWSHKVTFARN